MKNFFEEFKKFITRGNVIDMAVGVTVGSAFTAIVNSVTNNIIKPFINFLISLLIGADSLSNCFTYFKKVEVDGTVDLTQSIYIDWGAFINAIINFFVIAFVLFCVVKAINTLTEQQKNMTAKLMSNVISSADKKEMKKQGISLKDKEAVEAYFKAKELAAEQAKLEEEEKARLEREANPTAEDLLIQIRDLLMKK
jgi:large conductance mechanosensitive channel